MIIDNYIDKNDFVNLVAYINNKETIDKCDIIEGFTEISDKPIIEKLLLYFLNDTNYLVRCEVCDVLYHSKSKQIFNELIEHLRKEKNSYVRMYVISALCNILKSIQINNKQKQLLIYLYNKEKSKRVLIAYNTLCFLLYNNIDFIKKNFVYLNDKNYHIRHNAINFLFETINNNTYKLILDEYIKRKDIEKNRSVYLSLTRDISYIMDYYCSDSRS